MVRQPAEAAEVTIVDDVDITAVVPGTTPTPSGGGGSSPSQSATVQLAGVTFPGAKLTLLTDGQITTTLIAGNSGVFQLTLNNVLYGNYQFTILAQDASGNITSPYTINVSAFSSQPYNFTNIVLPPTFETRDVVIASGGVGTFFGYAAPGVTVKVEVPGMQELGQVVADSSGFYRLVTRVQLSPAIYSVRSKSITAGNVSSPYSRPMQIMVYEPGTPDNPGVPGNPGSGNPPLPPQQLAICVDYNRDRRINLIDFSILLFWFQKPNPPATIDCNADSVINIRDFSILMYFWTG